MEHQRQQHQPSISQQIQRLQMNRLNRDSQKKPQLLNSNGNSSDRVETYATLQKPPPNLMKPKLQSSRKQQFHSPNGESFLREDKDTDNHEEHSGELWPKRSKKDEDPPQIISGTVAAATAACYSPQPGGSNCPLVLSANGSSAPQQRPGVISQSSSVVASISPVGIQTKEQIFKNKLNPQLLSKIQQNMSNAGNVVANRSQPMSPNGKAGMNRNPIPKLMSRTKAQYQILRYQVSRPKGPPKSGAGVPTIPKSTIDEHPVASDTPSHGQNTTSASHPQSPRLSVAPNLQKPGPVTGSLRTDLVHKQQGETKQGVGPAGFVGARSSKLPPPTTVPAVRTASLLDSVARQQLGIGARRGTTPHPVRGRGGGLRGRGVLAPRRESLHSPAPSGGSGSDSDEDEYGYSTPSPPPTKTFRKSESISPAGRGKNNKSPPKSISTISIPTKISTIALPKKKDGEGERIYGKGYKCPPMDKVASYLTKKGTRIWICLVCEETEQEISRGPMICCDGCEDWYHFFCVGIDDEPPENEKWYCKRCIYKKLHTKKSVNKSDSDSDSGPSSGSRGNRRSSPNRKSHGGAGRGGNRGGRSGRGKK